MSSTKQPDPRTIALGQRIKRLRKRLGLKQPEAARLAGLTEAAFATYERGTRDMRAIDVPQLAAALQTDVLTLLGIRSETLALSPDRTQESYLRFPTAAARVDAATSIEDLHDLFVCGIQAGQRVPPDAEELTKAQWGDFSTKVEAKIARLGGIPRDW